MKRRSFLSGLLALFVAPKLALPDVPDGLIELPEVEFEAWSPAVCYEIGDSVALDGGYAVRADAFLAALPKFVQEVNARQAIKPFPPAPDRPPD